MKIWSDDVRPAPDGYVWCKSVNEAKALIQYEEKQYHPKYAPCHKCYLIDIDHDAGNFACDGGNYICLLNWLEETGRNYPIRIHSMNSVGVQNMRRIIERNGWKEVF